MKIAVDSTPFQPRTVSDECAGKCGTRLLVTIESWEEDRQWHLHGAKCPACEAKGAVPEEAR